MSNSKLTQVASAVRGSFDRRTIGGIVIGAAFVMSAMAVADTSGNAGWFSSLNSSSNASANGDTAVLLSAEESVIAAKMKAYMDACGNKQQGTIGFSVDNALKAHLTLASASPNVETLFDINGDCFSSINQIFDLSFAIPSLASILSAAQDAVVKYAEKKVCTAVNKVSGMVTDPINKAIGEINALAGFADINGMANGAIQSQMSSIDPQLGSQFHPPVANATITTNVNPFNTSQTTFNPGGGDQSGQINGDINSINTLIQEIGNLMITINQDNFAVNAAQQQLNSCNNHDFGDCHAQQQNLAAAQQKLAADQAALLLKKQQLANVSAGSGNHVVMPSAPAQPAFSGSHSNVQAASNGETKTFWSKVSGLFN